MNKVINNKTEKEFRDKQKEIGHIDSAVDLRTWLTDAYQPDSIRAKSYRWVANKFLGTSECLQVLEVGAGMGDYVIYCSKFFPQHKYHASDLSEPLLGDNIKTVAGYFGVEEIPPLTFGPVENLLYASESMDIVFVKSAVHHFEDPKRGFEEIFRILKPGGRVVFLTDPVCLDIPIYRTWAKKNFSLPERALGINEHIYTIRDYFSFGKKFSSRYFCLNEELVNEYDRHQKNRSGIKKFAGSAVRKWEPIFTRFMIWRFVSPLVFVFEK